MVQSRVFLSVLGMVAVMCAAAAVGEGSPRRKKLIQTGWDSPSPQQLRRDLREMEAQPFDGVVLQVTGRDEAGQPVRFGAAFEDRKWKRSWFQSVVADLKACRSARLTDNFLLLNANPGNVDWFDDAGWRNVVEHWRIAAWVARQGGVKGILFDAEPYAEPHRQFS